MRISDWSSDVCSSDLAELADLPEFTDSWIHIVTGLLLPIWKRLPDEGCRVYRLQTDDGERVIGRLVSPAWVAQAVATDTPTISPADAWTAVLDGRTVLERSEEHTSELQSLMRTS